MSRRIPADHPSIVLARAKGLLVEPQGASLLGAVPVPGREVRTKAESEKAFMADVVTLARQLGWLVYHTHDSRRSEPGYPDLTMVRAGRVVVAELKREAGKVTEAQAKWLDAFRAARVPAFVWRPSDWPHIQKTLENT
jgi:hypothetical protein